MAKRTLAENAAQAISDFKAIKNAMNTSGDADVFFNIPDGTPTSEYAERITAAIPVYGDYKYQCGEATGEAKGFTSGYSQGEYIGIEKGRQSQLEEFWTNFWASLKHKDGTGYGLYAAFCGGGWNKNTFKPIYPYEPVVVDGQGGCEMMRYFNRNAPHNSEIIDLTEFCKHIDFSQATVLYNTFADARAKNITADFSNATSLLSCFACSNGGYINNITLKVSEKCTFINTFLYCASLSNLTFTEDSIIAADINLSYSSLLTHDSLMSTINVLKDFSGTTTTKTLTLHAAAKARLTDAEIAIATQKGWSLL
jgi:hypothetical protein